MSMHKKEKGDDSMSVLAEYFKKNKNDAYNFATQNTMHDKNGRPVISKNDEWASETEWDDLFLELSKNQTKENK